MSPADRAIAAGWDRVVDVAGAEWYTGHDADAYLVAWDRRGFARDDLGAWASLGPSPQRQRYHPDEDAALTAALVAWGVA